MGDFTNKEFRKRNFKEGISIFLRTRLKYGTTAFETIELYYDIKLKKQTSLKRARHTFATFELWNSKSKSL